MRQLLQITVEHYFSLHATPVGDDFRLAKRYGIEVEGPLLAGNRGLASGLNSSRYSLAQFALT